MITVQCTEGLSWVNIRIIIIFVALRFSTYSGNEFGDFTSLPVMQARMRMLILYPHEQIHYMEACLSVKLRFKGQRFETPV
mgnify:FL=1